MNENIAKQLEIFKKICKHIDKIALREKLLLLFLSFAVIFGLWYFALMMPLERQETTIINQQKVIEGQIKTLQSRINKAKSGAISLKPAQVQFKAKLAALDNKIDKFSNYFVGEKEISDALQFALVHENLKLEKLTNLPTQQLWKIRNSKTGIYEQVVSSGMVLNFVGNYFGTMKYLQHIESLKWPIFWDKLSYKVTKYPEAKVVLRVHMLGLKTNGIR